LDAEKIYFRCRPPEESELFHVDDSVVRYNPEIKIIIDKLSIEKKIDAEEIDARPKDRERVEDRSVKQRGVEI
jgi:hypothetical protein